MNISQQRRDFRLLIHESEGKTFEDLFIKIMQYANTNFIPVKPHGSDGDRKNDGFDPSKGIYFQVYAPEDVNKNSYRAVKKLHEDFEGLQSYWSQHVPIQDFFFVINDKYKGVYPRVNTQLKRIKRQYNLMRCELFLAQHLEATLFGLSPDILEGILNSRISGQSLATYIPFHEKNILNSQPFFTSENHIETLVFELVQKHKNCIATPSDLCVYVPIVKKYGSVKGAIIVERSIATRNDS
jgi:hypothetical protein